ncbi:hypothetical protein LTR27_006727 [Elasticomyces elasticus]|nr:hypothetical protein LTR27_006727 [Elasticomyces elasticus]
MVTKSETVSSFVQAAPPGELSNVVEDIKALAPSEVRSLEPAFKKYNEEQYTTVKLSGSSQMVIVSSYNVLDDGRYFDTASQTSFEVDHSSQTASSAQSHTLGSRNADAIQSLLKAFSAAAAEHFPSSTVGVYPTDSDSSIAILLVANKYSPQNFWNGRWRSRYLFDPSSKSVSGTVKVDVHYYEDGNVRMSTSKKVEASSSSVEGIVREIAKAENKFQEELNRAFSTLAEGSFKGLRRQLPVTRQRVEWEKIAGYRAGSCRKGGACTWPHVIDPKAKSTTCFFTTKGKQCTVKNCAYLHPSQQGLVNTGGRNARITTAAANGGERSTASASASFTQWRYFVPPKDLIQTCRPLGPARTTFCVQALELINGGNDPMQETISLLASEGGCIRVKEIVGQPFDQLNPAEYATIFNTQLLTFFKAITHKNVTASLVLTSSLMTIYNIVWGKNGKRGVTCFAAVTKHLQTLILLSAEDPTIADSNTAETADVVLSALHKLVEVNTESQVHDGLKLVVETLRLMFEDPLPPTATYAYKPAMKNLQRIEQRLGLGQALPDVKSNAKAATTQAKFDITRERPGELADGGKRHDNDHVDIRRISILPTLEEIQSPRNEYLPRTDPREWHIGGLEGLFDRHFRLLREDMIGQLRDAAKFEFERLHSPQTQTAKQHGARTFVYRNVTVLDVAFDSFSGMEFAISFDQPMALKNSSASKRRSWWEESKRLGTEAFFCLLSSAGSATFFVVSAAPIKPKVDAETGKFIDSLHKHHNLWSEKDRAHIIAKAVVPSDIRPMLDRMCASRTEHLSLVEFPGVLLPAFMPTLQAMQEMSDNLDVPFADVLVPNSGPEVARPGIDLGPPVYATKRGFRYDLSCVTKFGESLYMSPGQDTEEVTAELTARSSLDYGQAHAVVSSLSQSLALIQGPPGTGKSYTGVQLIKILLANKNAGDLGPIVCICYTNHALDQGLERLVEEGVSNVIRIGGSSKSELLASVNLRVVARKLDLSKVEKHERWVVMNKIDEESQEISNILRKMGELGSETAVLSYLHMYYPDIHKQLLRSKGEDNFTVVDHRRGGCIEKWLRGSSARASTPGRPRTIQNLPIANMTNQERGLMYNMWTTEMREQLQDRLHTALTSYRKLKARLDAVRTELDLRALRDANIIGITTSGLARNMDLIRRTGAKVLVCEEAGEVLESHLLTALLPSVEHAILIGDHQQNYGLSCESQSGVQYSLDVSLFERLVRPQDSLAQPLPFCTLTVQRRMHPQISQLVRRTLYPRLEDAPTLELDRLPVVGIRKRLYWLDHDHKENGNNDPTVSASHTNDYEVEMVSALVKHLVQQGVYHPEDIAVITPYLGQLRKIRMALSDTFNIILNDRDTEDLQNDPAGAADTDESKAGPSRPATVARGNLFQAVRLATVDNFQGEEAKIVVVSLVRSNLKKNPGFLKTSNRINVLLSRAKNGMYIIGNADTMSRVDIMMAASDLHWSFVARDMKTHHCMSQHRTTSYDSLRKEVVLWRVTFA